MIWAFLAYAFISGCIAGYLLACHIFERDIHKLRTHIQMLIQKRIHFREEKDEADWWKES